MQPSIHICKHCGEQFEGDYCNKCGEKVYHDHHKTVGHLLEEAFHFITHFEGSFFKTLKTVFTRPGQLSYDYCKGVRKKYFKPISFFLLCVVIYLLFSPFEGLNMKLGTFMTPKYGFTWLSSPLVKQKMNSHTTDYKVIAEKYNKLSPKISKIFLLIILPLMGALLYVLFFKQRQYYFDHFILATEYASIWVTIKFILLPTIMLIAGTFNSNAVGFFDDSNWVLWIFINLFFLFILIMAFKHFYKQKWSWSILKGIIFLFTFEIIIMRIYHYLLFLTVMLFI